METKKIKSRTGLVVYALIVLGIVAVVNYAGSWWFSRLDLTENKSYSISPASKKLLKNLDDIINIKVYFSKNLPPNMLRTVNDVKDILSEYRAYGGKKLRITWTDPGESEKGKTEARSMGIPEIQMQTFEKDKAQVMNGYLGIAVLFADRKEVLPVVQNLQNLEYDLSLAIMKVSRAAMPKIGVLKTDTLPEIPPYMQQQMQQDQQSERTAQKFSTLIEKLKEAYDVSMVDVSKGAPIDNSIKTLIVPGSSGLSDRSAYEIDQYFMQGGKLILLAEAMKVEFRYMPMAVNVDSKLLDLVQSYGVKVDQDMILDASCGQVQIPQKVGPFTMNVAVPYPYFVRVGRDGFNTRNPAVAALSEVIMPWSSSLTLLVDEAAGEEKGKPAKNSAAAGTPVNATILARSSAKSWIAYSGAIDLNPQQQWQAPAAKDFKRSTLAVYLNGKFKSYFSGKPVPPLSQGPQDSLSKINLSAADAQRKTVDANPAGHCVVISNSNFASNQNSTPQNLMMMLNLVDWLSQDENLIGIRSRSMKDRTIEADLLKKGSATPNIVRFINIITMPLLVIIAGLVIFLRRREHAAASTPSTPPTPGSGTATEEKRA